MERDFSIHIGDCLDVMKSMEDHSVDMVLTDPPSKLTHHEWDKAFDLEAFWTEVERVAKPDAARVVIACEPFATQITYANLQWFRYDLVWHKNKPTGFFNANRMPLRAHERILVFYQRLPEYTPQKTDGHKPVNTYTRNNSGKTYGDTGIVKGGGQTTRHPTSVMYYPVVNGTEREHPSQKPEALLSFLIHSYTKEGGIVLDPFMGSGSSGTAALKAGRKFVGIEQDHSYAETAERALEAALTPREGSGTCPESEHSW